ncbi:MAG: cytochrome C oxidase subunit IV family protein [Vicinamibacterales bacterium]
MESHATSHETHAAAHALDIDRQVRGYIIVFVSLLALTVVTVAVSYLHLQVYQAVLVALSIAIFKASLVALFFMHLISERRLIFVVLAFTAAFFFALLFLPILTNADRPSL